LDLQTDELIKLGCQKIYQEKVSSSKERIELIKMIENLREGDSVMVWKLDRLGRSLKELINLILVGEWV
jgi:DNA invertase Pin-like site-specific DNA recombinase